MGSTIVLLMIGGGVFFTVISIVAWTTGRRVGSIVLAALAGADFAFAIALISRVSGG